MTALKPIAGIETVTSANADAAHDAKVETWGETISAAGGRICRWAVTNGAALPFECPKPIVPD